MIVTIEPGIYKEKKHGIRLENVYYVKLDRETEIDRFFSFSPLTYLPFDLDCIDFSLLSDFELEILNNYHSCTYELLNKYLSGEVLEWFKNATRKILR